MGMDNGREFGKYVPESDVQFIEPPWKAILSNKGLLPLLWGMFENHPNLLPAFLKMTRLPSILPMLGPLSENLCFPAKALISKS